MSRLLVLGTRNGKKREEMENLLAGLDIELADLSRWPELPDVVEDGLTFEANARKKAGEVASQLHHWVLAEDSGLVVPALDGQPGVFSARYAGRHGDDAANNSRLLAGLSSFPEDRRGAYYVCVGALADPAAEIMATSEGRCYGVITRELRGGGGFGYDPLFLIREYHRTFGELSSRLKHAISHRARAMEELRPIIRRLLGPQAAVK